MTQADAVATGGGAKAWIFRGLVVAGGALMVYSWYTPWWSAKFSAIPGSNHMILRPWGIEAVGRVRQFSDNALYDMPAFFAPMVWVYFAVCMLALALSLFISRQISLGRMKVSVASLLIGFVGLSYLATAAIAYGVGVMRADAAKTNFLGKSKVTNPNYNGEITMTSQLEAGYWLVIAAGVVLVVLALIRSRFVAKTGA